MGSQGDTHPSKADEGWRTKVRKPTRQEKCDIGVNQIESIDRVIAQVISGMIECHQDDCYSAQCVDFRKSLTLGHAA
jgi:hypothetical protein